MNTSRTCPLCVAGDFVEGGLLLAGGFSEGLRLVFPRHRERLLSPSFWVDSPSSFNVCTGCGLLWGYLSPNQLEILAAARNQVAVAEHPVDCPSCKSSQMFGGSLFHPDAISLNPLFLPSNVSRFRPRFDLGVELQSNLNSCFDCGLVCGQISPTDLNAFSSRYASARATSKFHP